jgi:hypothetical protein
MCDQFSGVVYNLISGGKVEKSKIKIELGIYVILLSMRGGL